MMGSLDWLPKPPENWQEQLDASGRVSEPATRLERLWPLSRYRLDVPQTLSLHRNFRAGLEQTGHAIGGFTTLRAAILASSTVEHLIPFIELAAFRRRIILEVYTGVYGQYRQEIINPGSELHRFRPDVVTFALDAAAVPPQGNLLVSPEELNEMIQAQIGELSVLWEAVSRKGWTVIQQNIVVPTRAVLGHLDAGVPGTPRYWYNALNDALAAAAKNHGTLLFDVDGLASQVGKDQWLNEPLWHHAKQSFSPDCAPLYADHLTRLLAGVRGLSKKCLVLDLDNTLWGGVIGDDGLENIEIGQGTGVGEAYVAFQSYLRLLKARGVVLAVCSKNEEHNARLPFEKHPDMVLRLDDFVVFVANWQDKISNLKKIAEELRLGLDSFVFFDDHPVERHLIRQAYPMVEVPEVPEDPALYVACLSDAGYFETVSFTHDDTQRSAQYAANRKRRVSSGVTPDPQSFLKDLNMKMTVSPFDGVSRSRTAQLINKSNQFNLTTRRYTEKQVELMQRDPQMLTFQIRLEDAYGDNGLISVVILRPFTGSADSRRIGLIDTWLMSCRVLGRQVEQEVLNVVAEQARRRGFESLRGEYIPTEKNGLVRDHYANLGFIQESADSSPQNGKTIWQLPLADFKPFPTMIQSRILEEAQNA